MLSDRYINFPTNDYLFLSGYKKIPLYTLILQKIFIQRSIPPLLFGVLLAGAITHGCGRSNGGKGTDQYTINEAFGDYQIHFFQTDEGKEFGITDTLEETLTKQGQTTKIVYEDGTGRSRLDGKVDRVTITYPDGRRQSRSSEENEECSCCDERSEKAD